MATTWRRCAGLAIAAGLCVQACASSTPPRQCETEAECSSTARCISGMCVANAAPVPAIELPSGAVEANRLLTFDASSSADADDASGDAIVSCAWTFRALGAPCEPPVAAGTGPTAQVRFGCAGTYAVDLTVTDEMGASAVATREFTVGAYAGPKLVEISPDLAVQHACSVGPPRCTPLGTIVLSATPTADAPADLAFQWTLEPPPDRPLGPSRRVTFDPSADVASPTVAVETDGQAISGDWIFHLVVRDAAGVVATGATRLSVANRAPVVTEHVSSGYHAFDGTRFTASGSVSFTVTDPDGDELVGRTITPHHVNDGPESVFALTEGAARVDYAIAVPYSAPPDAAHLIGGVGLERSITFRIGDVNGAVTTESWPVEVGNRPPVAGSTPGPFTVDHVYSAAGQAYEAEATLSAWTDPDGDPLVVVPGSSTGDAACARLTVASGVALVSCSVPFSGAPAAGSIAGDHSVEQRVKDPWVEASPATVTFTIGNRPPSIDATAWVDVPVTGCRFMKSCCAWEYDPEFQQTYCTSYYEEYGSGSTTVTGRWRDPDGDPLEVSVAGTTTAIVCTPGACAVDVTYPETSVCTGSASVPRATTAGDGVATASATLTLLPGCQ